MDQQIDPLTDEELSALVPKFDATPALENKLTSDERRRLTKIRADKQIPSEPDLSESPAPIRFMGGVAQTMNPVPFLSALKDNPVEAARGLVRAQGDQLGQGYTQLKGASGLGDVVSGLGHLTAGALPILGPAAAHAGETIAGGDVAGGFGQATGLLAPFIGKPIAKAGVRMLPNAIADMADAASSARLVETMAPKVGAKKVEFGNMAAKVAPDLAREPGMGAFSREGLSAKVDAQFEAAKAGLDTAANNRNPNLTYPTGPILDALRDARARLTAQTQAPQTGTGSNIVPGPNKGQVAIIDQAIDEVRSLGPQASYESLRRIREAYDKPASARYNAATTPYYQSAQAGQRGAVSVTSALRDALAGMDPDTATANGTYSLWKNAKDVLDATAEREQVRPKVGRGIMARASGAMVGAHEGGVVGAGIGAAVASVVDKMVDAAPTTKIYTARLLASLADAIRNNRPAQVASVKAKLAKVTSAAGAAGGTVGTASQVAGQPEPDDRTARR